MSIPVADWSAVDRHFMKRALELARRAEEHSEVPVGALVVRSGAVLGEGWNQPLASHDPTAHAEIVAIRAAALEAGNYRLPGATLYVTLEPCVMCVGAMVIARIERVVFAARDLRFGAVRSKFSLADSDLLNHRILVEEGLCGAEAGERLTQFFRTRRADGEDS